MALCHLIANKLVVREAAANEAKEWGFGQRRRGKRALRNKGALALCHLIANKLVERKAAANEVNLVLPNKDLSGHGA